MNTPITFGSVCSGIEAASVAWHPLGWRAAWLAEIEPFPSAVLAHHYPDTPNLGDMTTIARRVLTGEVAAPDVFTGGTPCQAFSVAGLRESLADARGNLTLKFVELADAIDHVRARAGRPPCIIVWENVPGVLSTKDNAYGCFLAGLAGEDGELQPPGRRWEDAGAVYGPRRAVAWRTLDAQYFGLAQRRRRVFVVASARNDFDPAQVLFEWEGVRRDTAPSRAAGQEPAPCVTAGAGNGSAAHGAKSGSAKDNLIVPVHDLAGTLNSGGKAAGSATSQDAESGLLVAFGGGQNCAQTNVATALHAHPGGSRLDFQTETFITHSLRGEGFDASKDGTGRGTPLVPVSVAHTLQTQCGSATEDGTGRGSPLVPVSYAVCFDTTQITSAANYSNPKTGDPCHPLAAGAHAPAVATPMQVRRLTPEECEALQGFPRGYTLIPWRGKPASECPDGPRYKALGNSWAVPVARWVGRRIVERLGRTEALEPETC